MKTNFPNNVMQLLPVFPFISLYPLKWVQKRRE